MKIDSIKIEGFVKLDIYDKNGKLKDTTGWLKNTITKAGMAQIALLAGDATAVPFTYLAVGTSSAAESADHTTLQAEITDSGLARAAATVSRVETTNPNDTLKLYKEFTATGTKAVEEVGIFNDSSAGTMLGRKLTTTKTVNDTEVLAVTYKVKFS